MVLKKWLRNKSDPEAFDQLVDMLFPCALVNFHPAFNGLPDLLLVAQVQIVILQQLRQTLQINVLVFEIDLLQKIPQQVVLSKIKSVLQAPFPDYKI